jgi:hypothetical protein
MSLVQCVALGLHWYFNRELHRVRLRNTVSLGLGARTLGLNINGRFVSDGG